MEKPEIFWKEKKKKFFKKMWKKICGGVWWDLGRPGGVLVPRFWKENNGIAHYGMLNYRLPEGDLNLGITGSGESRAVSHLTPLRAP
ncbi:hypothetical protein HY095_03855 [Candidatus Micrarchaeota archaeon]|nr:hypothetical protein [Candidatus Micrarchaeota archaeon]